MANNLRLNEETKSLIKSSLNIEENILNLGLNKWKNKLKELLDKLEEIGVEEIWFEHINLNTNIKSRLYEFLKKESPEIIADFEKADTVEYREELEKVIKNLMEGRKMKMAMGQIIYHRNLRKKYN